MSAKVVLIGAGLMAREYAKVLEALSISYEVIGRGGENCKLFSESYPKAIIHNGGIENNLTVLSKFTHAIVATNVINLAANTSALIKAGVKNCLVEKPGFLNPKEAYALNEIMSDSSIYVAYNRRFLASVIKAQQVIKNDGGVLSFNFEFTEWSHVIDKLECPIEEKNFLFLANSTHVVDLAFYLGGFPAELKSYRSGQIDWHKTGAIYSGAGKTDTNALFSYNANWISAGRWVVEILTANNRLLFKPLEKLQIQQKGSVAVNFVEDVDYTLDETYKPGLYLQTKKFLEGEIDGLCSFREQMSMLEVYKNISGY